VTALRLSRIFWIGAAAILIAAALVALFAVLRGDFSDTDARILGTLAALLLAGATFVSGLALVDRHGALLGRVAAVLTFPGLALLLYPIWDFDFESGDSWRFGWTGALLLLALLIAVTARLLARSPGIVALASVTGVLAVFAALVSVAAVWDPDSGDTFGQAIVAVWILTVLCYLLVPVLQRFSAAGVPAGAERVLAELNGIELVATQAREGTLAVDLEPGERLLLRRAAQTT
jgi:hypothetical protein